mgnify:CR=1 FL=1
MRSLFFRSRFGIGIILTVLFLQSIPVHRAQAWTITTRSEPDPPRASSWTLTTLPVGHGDAHVLESPDGQISVIDTGSTETVDRLIDHLDRNEIESIDRIVITHPHWDHIGGTLRLLDEFSVERILRPDLKHPTKLTHRIENRIREENVPVRKTTRGDTFNVGGGNYAQVLNPGDTSSGGLNRNSVAFYTNIGQVTLLMMGDVVGSAENELLNRDLLPEADILKVAHHGNANGTSRRFLKRVEPALALLPAPLRKNDPWGKPDPELIRRLQNFRIPTFQTGKVGTISVRFDRQTLRTVEIDPSQRRNA